MIGIFGANGFIGRHLAQRLQSRGRKFKAISRHFTPDFVAAHGGSAELVEANFADPLAMVSALDGLDTVVQLVSTSSPGMQNLHSIADIRDNVIPHVAFLQTCVAAGVRRYVFLSSGGTVYGPTNDVPIREDSETNPISSHGLTKLMVEKYIQMHGRVDGLDYVILRLANPFGPGQHYRKAQGLIPAILGRHQEGLPVKVIGDGSARRDYVFIDDVIDAIELAVGEPRAARGIINIGSGEARSVSEILGAIEDILGLRIEREYVDVRKTDVAISQLDIGRASSLLGWRPKTPFRTGLERTLAEFSPAPRVAR